jgi:hypothetical protein
VKYFVLLFIEDFSLELFGVNKMAIAISANIFEGGKAGSVSFLQEF